MNWAALRNELQASTYLEPEDDLTTQRGIVATALAIVERMSVETRDVSWRPYRLLQKVTETPLTLDGSQGADKPGNAPVPVAPTPRKPQPGGMAVDLPRLSRLATTLVNAKIDPFAVGD